MEAMQFVKGSERLVEAMGGWPSFHDATVVDASCAADTFSVKLHVFAMTDKVDPAGYYILERHHLVSFRFLGVRTNTLPADYSRDCLFNLTFRRLEGMVQADFESHTDQDGSIVCTEVSVMDVLPYSRGE
ncbi:MAG TPA: Imm50 family immunity protein [Chthoniobacteraceae bacterium]|nr:Imm50 family immunity protein [Chthoniobacteraceae bacterium]